MQIHFTEEEKEMFIYKLDTENGQKLHNERQWFMVGETIYHTESISINYDIDYDRRSIRVN